MSRPRHGQQIGKPVAVSLLSLNSLLLFFSRHACVPMEGVFPSLKCMGCAMQRFELAADFFDLLVQAAHFGSLRLFNKATKNGGGSVPSTVNNCLQSLQLAVRPSF